MSAKKKTVKKVVKKSTKKAPRKKIQTINYEYREDGWGAIVMSDEMAIKKIPRSKVTTVSEFLKTGKSAYSVNGNFILEHSRSALLLSSNGGLYVFGFWVNGNFHVSSSDLKRSRFNPEDENLFGMVVPSSKKGYKFFLVVQADNGYEPLKREKNCCSVSLSCIGNMINVDIMDACKKLVSREMRIVDFTQDEERKVSSKIKKMMKDSNFRWQEIVAHPDSDPPESGFSLIKSEKSKAVWHRSGSVLVRYNGKTYLFGQDESTYFGCELQDNPIGITRAYTSLIPAEARNKKNVVRQGEWFVVPVMSKDVPTVTNRCAEFNTIGLPRDDEDASCHDITNCDMGVVSKDGVIFAEAPFVLCHQYGDHEDIKLRNGWYKFVHNTAVRSVSQEGVD